MGKGVGVGGFQRNGFMIPGVFQEFQEQYELFRSFVNFEFRVMVLDLEV